MKELLCKIFIFACILFNTLQCIRCLDINDYINDKNINVVDSSHNRTLFILTCETGGFSLPLRLLNASSIVLKDVYNIELINACCEAIPEFPYFDNCADFRKDNFLVKPKSYMKGILEILNKYPDIPASQIHMILADSDTFFSSFKLSNIWEKYDLVRGSKSIVASTEMNCWVGRHCEKKDYDLYYSMLKGFEFDSPSLFLNSGLIMGESTSLIKMLKYVIDNQNLFIKEDNHYFDDQWAIAYYSLVESPSEVQLDTKNELFATFTLIFEEGDGRHEKYDTPSDLDRRSLFGCRHRDGNFGGCSSWISNGIKEGHFIFEKDNCQVKRRVVEGMHNEQDLRKLSSNPVVWHGNGVGKKLYRYYAFETTNCLLKEYPQLRFLLHKDKDE